MENTFNPKQLDSLRNYLSDMLALEKHVLEAVKRQSGDERTRLHPEALALVSKIEGVLQGHISETDQHLSSLGGDLAQPLKEAVSTIAGVAAGFIDQVRSANTVSKLLRDNYSALSLDAIGYTMLHTTGLALKSPTTAALALRHLMDISPLIVQLSEVVPLVVAKELIDDGEAVDTTVGPEAVRNTQRAWKNDVVRDH